MKKIVRKVVSVLMCGAMLAAPLAEGKLGALAADVPTAVQNLNDYLIRPTYLEAVSGGYMRVCYTDEKICIEYLNSSFEVTSRKTLDLELPVWGGFYNGSDGYYIVEGQNNKDCVDGTEVVRIIKYSKDWQRVGAGSVKAKDGWEYEIRYPFDVGCVNFCEANGKLYVITGREGYVDESVGQGHQGMMLISVVKSDMTTKIEFGDFWHSFSQYLRADGNNVYVYEQSEGSGATKLSRYDATRTDTNYFNAFKERFNVLEYGGDRSGVWSVACRATVDALELSADNILGLGTSIDQTQYDNYSSSTPYNIYLTITPKNSLNKDSTTVKWLTDYTDGKRFKGVSFTRINSNKFMVSWELSNSTQSPAPDLSDPLSPHVLHYMFIDGSGNKLGKEYTANAAWSNCQPVVSGSSVVFEASNGSLVDFYTINTSTGAFSKKVCRAVSSTVTWDVSGDTLTISGTGEIPSNVDWGSLKDSIKYIVVEPGITSIGDYVFSGFYNLEKVTIGDGVKTIGKGAFGYCFSSYNDNQRIIIPDSVTNIGEDLVWSGWYWRNSDDKVNYGTICSTLGSYAITYAKENNINYSIYLDIFSDEKINMKDLVRLQQYLNHFNVSVDEFSADVTRDGKINLKDYVCLRRYLNRWPNWLAS